MGADIHSIVFVHGLGSNPDTTWRAENQAPRIATGADPQPDSERYVNWVSDFLPDDLSQAAGKDIRMYFYNYDSYWKRDAIQTRLSTLANGLLDHIGRIRQSKEVRIKHGGLNSTTLLILL
jgi:hypothetical protein